MKHKPTNLRGIALDRPLVAVVELEPTTNDARRLCIHRGDETYFTLVEQSKPDGDWQTIGSEPLDTFSIRQIDVDAGIATQEGVEQ